MPSSVLYIKHEAQSVIAKKIQEYNRAVARQAEEKELRERRERVRRAQEANRKAQEEAAK
ncbi:unnamed protein product, partial [Cylicostephanus goldi]